ncbi:MAG TPA: hypothetical protein VGC41_03030, partial [Kofleriaceae bacterium]
MIGLDDLPSLTYISLIKMVRVSKQLSFADQPSWGGRRKGAGRKRRLPRVELPHRARPVIDPRLPLHVTLRMAAHVYSLRSRRSLRVVEKALQGGADRFGLRVVQASIQGNHVHLLVEANDK